MQDRSRSASGQKAKAGRAPISAHPIFPIVVAIWFAALLGIGSLILPIAIFERLFALTGFSTLVSAAQAPLGMTARLMIALAGAVVGAIAGLLIARKVASTQHTTGGSKRFGGADADRHNVVKKPISAHEELGSDSLDDPIDTDSGSEPEPAVGYNGRRRKLAVTDDSGQSKYLEAVPLPGGPDTFDNSAYSPFAHDEPDELDEAEEADAGAQVHDEPVSDFRPPVSEESEPLELAVLAEPDQLEADAYTDVEPQHFAIPAEPSEAPSEESFDEVAAAQPVPAAEDNPQEYTSVTDHSDPEMQTPYNPLHQMPVANVKFSPPIGAASVFDQARPFDAVPEAVEAQHSPVFAAPFAPPAAEEAPVEHAAQELAADAGEPVSAKPLNELGMVELVERFAMALQSKPGVPTAVEEGVSEPEPTEQAAEPMVFRRASSFDAPEVAAEVEAPVEQAPVEQAPVEQIRPAIPAAFQPLAVEDDDDIYDDDEEVEALSLNLASIHNTAQPAQPTAYEPEEQEETVEEAGYSSLLDLKGSTREFVRIEEDESDQNAVPEPVVVFPGQDDRRAAPAADGTPREPIMEKPSGANRPKLRAFDAPSDGVTRPSRAAEPAEANETERALREALEKLQRMSGAA